MKRFVDPMTPIIPNRVAVTGMGCITPVGNGTSALWNAMLTRRSDIRAVESRTPPLRCGWVAPVDTEILAAAMPKANRASGDPTADMLTVAADQALRQAGWEDGDWGSGVAVLIGSGAGSTHALHEAYSHFFLKGQRMRPTTIPRCMPNSLSARLAIQYRLTGPNYILSSACASSTIAIGTAYRMIRHGLAERVLCGGVETVMDPSTRYAWDRLGVLTSSETAAGALLPFDRRRDGFVLGEGAGVLILESFDAAQRRGAGIIGEVAGYGESSDASHITQPDSDGQAKALTHAIADAGVYPGDINLIMAHGTATVANDRCESRALRHVFGQTIETIPVLALKPLWGHMLGASGAIESIACLQALEAGQLPPDPLTSREPDPECSLNFASAVSSTAPLEYIIKNSFAFGGSNAVLIFRRNPTASTLTMETCHAS